jgi:hypothetical protein
VIGNRKHPQVSSARSRGPRQRRAIPSGRCSLCGRSTEKHGVVLIAVRLAREQESISALDNSRLYCVECNEGRECSTEPPEPAWMGTVMAQENVHMRLGETLKVFDGEPVSASTLKLVAGQDGWTTRVRELRYLGWEIEAFKRKLPNGRVSSYYRLNKWQPWPSDPTGTIREYERRRAQRNRASK